MRERELAKEIIDRLPEYKVIHLLTFLQGMAFDNDLEVRLRGNSTPNAETLEASFELDHGGGFHFSGTTEQLFSQLEQQSPQDK